MKTRLIHNVLQLRKRLWAKPLLYCFMAVVASFFAQAADYGSLGYVLPEIEADTIQTLLSIISSSMLAVATFAVGSMVASYASASSSATPRAFALVLADDVSQTALSSFIGAFIFSIVSIVALKTGFYGAGGRFVLFVMTLAIFAWVILTFVRWVDNIARLGRLGTTIDKAEAAALACLKERRLMPFLGGVEKTCSTELTGTKVFCDDIGYIQYVDMGALQTIAVENDIRIMVDAMPGSFLAPGRPIAILDTNDEVDEKIPRRIASAFVFGDNRTFDEDPRFGLIVLSEIASRALSPAVNDSGTAIVIIGRFVRLFAAWAAPVEDDEKIEEKYDRVIIPTLSLAEMFDDAFTAMARDGAGTVEVGIRLQKAFLSLSTLDYAGFRDEARRHSALALERANGSLSLKDDFNRVERIARLLD
ncbi:DUF2254 domain-containing protein [Antarcticimicrobium sediminis]|uniref:DUF2254 domain-containing protein n=1 Tax=Antarcticimicrobium sediminis TaxID=2546227 RepID=A0A4R5EX42_9RHOB|nr:DUF2254 domain-containing protein [Antarcticimicrobium sediminis]TDE39531.1 DUF2254 domain-containing protein [Antarcticimicrobium sediminis]